MLDSNDVESLLKLRQPMFSHVDSRVVQFMFEHNVAVLVVFAVLSVFNPIAEIAIDSLNK